VNGPERIAPSIIPIRYSKSVFSSMRKSAVNLLQQRGAPPTFWERLYEWVTNTCRIIVIVTELLVLGAFGWRFWLDRKLNDLKRGIESKGEVLKGLSEQEQEIRALQAKMSSYRQLLEGSSDYTSVIREINGYIPSGVEDLTVAVGKRDVDNIPRLTISGQLDREKISDLENSLKDSTNLSDVALSSIERESEESTVYSFTLSAKIISTKGRDPLS